MKIREIIVVEGKDDTVAILRAVDADTIETNGSAINEQTIEKIKLAAEKRGVIVFTDPDYPGERIRSIITKAVPNCKHAFLPKSKALGKAGESIGVEHASPEDIRLALSDAHYMAEDPVETITRDDLLSYGLIAGPLAKSRRERLGEYLKIGYTNGKQLYKRLQVFEISREVFIDAVKKILQEEQQNGL